ncbi:15011_t:CDS:2, partial [Gigaspora margarita]
VAHSSALIDNKLYFSGGIKFNGINTNEFFYLDVSKLFTTTDNDSMPWVDLTYTGGPFKVDATACIGGKHNDMIFIFGGISHTIGDLFANQSFINQFDTNKQQWSNITSIGNVPTNRAGISCANFDNGLIAIFSGASNSTLSDLWILNATTFRTFQWSKGNILNPIEDLALAGHTATLVDNYMLVAYGGFPNHSFSSKIFMLDVSRNDSYKWVTEFSANTTTTPIEGSSVEHSYIGCS